jgi:hypothetical protein
LEVEALVRHADGNVADAGPGIEPRAKSPEGAVVGWARKPGEAECCSQELAALVEHGYWMISSARSKSDCGMVSPSVFAVLRSPVHHSMT